MNRSVQGCSTSRKCRVLLPMLSSGERLSPDSVPNILPSQIASASNIPLTTASEPGQNTASKAIVSQRFDFFSAGLINKSEAWGRAPKVMMAPTDCTHMRKPGETLEDLRSEIDQIDDALHDLLIQRTEVSRAIAKVKQARDPGSHGLAPSFRPAREAAIVRRLLSRHNGDMPRRVLARIWREIIAASLQGQTRFQLHVYAADNHPQLIDLAHAHFGSYTPVRLHTRPSLVVHACAEEPDSVGVVPLPVIEEGGAAWWAQLAPAGEKGARVVAKLPFVSVEGDVAAYAIAAIEQEPSGDDTTLLLLEIAPSVSRQKLRSLLKRAGLDARLVAAGRLLDKNVPDELLLEVGDFVAPSDARLANLAEAAGEIIGRVTPIGGYANPVVLPGAT